MNGPAPAPVREPMGGPFLVFGAVAALAAIGAVFEISYWVGISPSSPAIVGTAGGILLALAAFFLWGFAAPPNR
jgi:hypothetical protein